MLNNHLRHAPLLLFSLCVSGCLNFDSGDSGDSEIKGCNIATAQSVVMELEARYALGASTTLFVSGLETPTVTSSNPDIVSVGPIRDDEVTLSFLARGEASITVQNGSDAATSIVAVARVERFEVVLPAAPHLFTPPPDPDQQLPLEGKALVDPAFEVFYFDSDGRLYGKGLAQTTWARSTDVNIEAFSNSSLESGPHQVEVRVGDLVSVISFEAVAHDEVETPTILETELSRDRFRVDAVGLTAAGTQVWNISPYFDVDGQIYFGSFEYTFDPDAPPTTVKAGSFILSTSAPTYGAETTIHRVEPEDKAHYATVAVPPRKGRAPLMAILSLLMMTLAIRASVRVRPRFGAPQLKAEADTPS